MNELPYAALLTKLAAMFVVMGVGWWMRRANWLAAGATATLSNLTIQVAFPCLTLDQMLRTLDRAALQQSVPLIGLGFVMMVLSAAVGVGMTFRWNRDSARGRTAAFLIAIPNWIFLPLPLAQAVAGDVGTRTILLLNVPAQVVLWTLGLGLLRGEMRGAHGVRGLLTNPGLLATAAGILLALVYPPSARWAHAASPVGALMQGVGLLGLLTIPLSLLITGAQLAETQLVQFAPGALARVLLGRLIVAPLVCVLLLEFGGRLLGLDPAVRLVACLVAAMPVAVSCGVFIERYGGDRDLGAQSVLLSTLASVLTVPVLVAMVEWVR